MLNELVVTLVLVLAAGSAHAAPAVGEAPPDWLGKTPRGEDVRISERRGKVVVVSFWALWCGYCRRQLPILEALQQAAGRERLEVVVINYKEPPRAWREIVPKLKGLTVTMTHDRDGAISEAYAVNAVPRLFMLDKAGRLAWTYNGHFDSSIHKIEAAANRLLSEPWPPRDESNAQSAGTDASAS